MYCLGVTRPLPPFHLAIPVRDLAESRRFYGALLGCAEGRSAPQWVDFDFFGHQLVCHVAEGAGSVAHNPVDGDQVPVPHFGAVLDPGVWAEMAQRLKGEVEFVIEPHTRFKGQAGEQSTMFFLDPSGNAIELKAFADLGQLFARDPG